MHLQNEEDVEPNKQRDSTMERLDQRKRWKKTTKGYTPDLHFKMDETKTKEFYCAHPTNQEGQDVDVAHNSKETKVRWKPLPASS